MKSPPQVNLEEFLDNPLISVDERKNSLTELDRTNLRLGVYKNFIHKLFKWLVENNLPKEFSLLEIGSGSGGLAREILNFSEKKYKIDYHVMDIDHEILAWIKRNRAAEGKAISTHLSGDTHLKQFKTKQFDVIISLQVLHHIHPLAVISDFFVDVMDKSSFGFWIADFERKSSNSVFLFLGNLVANTSEQLAEDGRRSLLRSYTNQEILQSIGHPAGWNISSFRYWWNPFQIVSGIRKIVQK